MTDRQPTAHDAYADVPGTDTAAPVHAGEPAPEVVADAFRAAVGAQVVDPTQDGATPDPDEDNPRAARVLGKRAADLLEPTLVVNIPAEEGYHCPVCMYLHEGPEGENGEPGELDERLAWSEYRTMIWCAVCERDYPSMLCTPDFEEATRIYLAAVEQLVELRLRELRDRAARWASELADVERALGEDLGTSAAGEPDEIAEPLAPRVDRAITQAYADGSSDGEINGRKLAAAGVSVDVLARALRVAESLPMEPVDDETRARAEYLHRELAAELGWSA